MSQQIREQILMLAAKAAERPIDAREDPAAGPYLFSTLLNMLESFPQSLKRFWTGFPSGIGGIIKC